MKTAAYAAHTAHAPLAPLTIERRPVGPNDVAIDILYCGVCHSDIHQVRQEWGPARFPMVPGHEIVGRVAAVGEQTKGFAAGDLVGVGCMVHACGACRECGEHHEQFCARGTAWTYNSTEMDRTTPTYGGYSRHVVVDAGFVLRVPAHLDPAAAAPLLCAGITTYSPLKQWGCGPGTRVGVLGLGGLGHMAVKLAVSMGAHVTMLSQTASKEADAKRLGAQGFLLHSDPTQLRRAAGFFDLIIDTVSVDHDISAFLGLLGSFGTLVLVGAPPSALSVIPWALLSGNKRLVGSSIGGIQETQEMLDHCGKHNITSDVEVIRAQDINVAYERMLKGDVRYRFVIDTSSLEG